MFMNDETAFINNNQEVRTLNRCGKHRALVTLFDIAGESLVRDILQNLTNSKRYTRLPKAKRLLLVTFNIPQALTSRRQFYEAVSGANKLSEWNWREIPNGRDRNYTTVWSAYWNSPFGYFDYTQLDFYRTHKTPRNYTALPLDDKSWRENQKVQIVRTKFLFFTSRLNLLRLSRNFCYVRHRRYTFRIITCNWEN